MQTIHKFQLASGLSRQSIAMPMGAQILDAQNQNGAITLWARVNNGVASRIRCFQVTGTGHECPDGFYIATVQQDGFVWHVFEVAP